MRPGIDEVMLSIADALSRRATCKKLAVGCVLVDINFRIIGTGYNGVPSGWQHCTEDAPCEGSCLATHAESNALLSCNPTRRPYVCYTTYSPCLACCKQLIQSGCRSIVFVRKSSEHDEACLYWSMEEGNTWYQYKGKTVEPEAQKGQ